MIEEHTEKLTKTNAYCDKDKLILIKGKEVFKNFYNKLYKKAKK